MIFKNYDLLLRWANTITITLQQQGAIKYVELTTIVYHHHHPCEPHTSSNQVEANTT